MIFCNVESLLLGYSLEESHFFLVSFSVAVLGNTYEIEK